MYETILLKKNLVSGEIPTVSDLKPGELAINVPDGKIYMIKGAGTTESERTVTRIDTNSIAIDSITDEADGLATVTLEERTDVIAGERVMITPDDTDPSPHNYDGLYYVKEVISETEIVIYADSGSGGNGGEFRIYAEEDTIQIVYTGTNLNLDAGDAIVLDEGNIYSSIYVVISQSEGAGEYSVTVNGNNYGDVEFSEGEMSLYVYDYEIVTFFSTSESMIEEIRTNILNSIQVSVQRDEDDNITNVKLVDRNTTVIG